MIEIKLTQSKTAMIDDIDIDLSILKWFTIKQGIQFYACKGHKHVRMHRLILERILKRTLMPGEFVDHIDHNGLNNQRSNLRLATKNENCQNRTPNKTENQTSIYKGVIWHKGKQQWQSRIRIKGKRIYLGYFKLEKDAANAYNQAAKIYHGEFACINKT